mmetsp:Transcript_63244/g.136905  ORF Transcript_63244/g.136905 Transcript_63244/m.136905 type:complete len:115 (-) Transcript_63244:2806-3150(-)
MLSELFDLSKSMQSREQGHTSNLVNYTLARFISGDGSFRNFNLVSKNAEKNKLSNRLICTAVSAFRLTEWNIDFLMCKCNDYNEDRIIREIYTKLKEFNFLELELNSTFKTAVV